MDVTRRIGLLASIAALSLAAACSPAAEGPGASGGGNANPSPSGATKGQFTAETAATAQAFQPGTYKISWKFDRKACPRLKASLANADGTFKYDISTRNPNASTIVQKVQGDISVTEPDAACKGWSITMERTGG
jgi:hypothetical protein